MTPPELPGAASAPVQSPGRDDRLRDVLALALLALGIILILVSNAGMHRLATQPIVVAHGEFASTQYEHFRRIGMIGYVAAAAGVLAGIWSHVLHAKRGSADAAPTSQL